jgi:hypothetical protein
MPYKVKLPPAPTGDHLLAGGSPISEKPVTPVTGGDEARPGARPDSLGFGSVVARLVRMPLHVFEREGCPLEVRVGWLPVTLWFVPRGADVEALAQEGVSRGRVWTARDLADLLSIPGLTPEQARTIAHAKLEFGGVVVEVRERSPDQERGGEPV